MSNAPVLVTGGAGYIGSHAVLALKDAGREVVIIDNLSRGPREAVPPDVCFCEGDVADGETVAALIQRQRIGAVMHFAGSISVPESVADPALYYRNNTCASLALARVCLQQGVGPFIFSSTAAVYGVPDSSPVEEDAPKAPISPYGASKLMTERMLKDLAFAHPGFRPMRLRYFNVAGADAGGRAGPRGADTIGLVRFAVQAALGRREGLDIYGDDYPTRDGTGERDYIHVSDLADAHVAALTHLEGGGQPLALNLGYGRGSTVLEVVAALERLLGREVPKRLAPRRPGDPPSAVSDICRLRRSLSWRPRYDDLDTILQSALAWESIQS